MEPVIFKETDDGRCLAVRNWRHRANWDDAMVAEPLDPGQRALYRREHAAGVSDEVIYDHLFPDAPPPAGDLADLPADLLRGLLEDLVGQALPSLSRATRRDLATLLRHAMATARR